MFLKDYKYTDIQGTLSPRWLCFGEWKHRSFCRLHTNKIIRTTEL